MSLDDVLDLLSSKHRRNMMYAMDDHEDEVIEYNELVDYMVDEGYIGEKEKEQFKTQMFHIHLPKMRGSGVVEYSNSAETLRRVPNEEVDKILDFIEKFEE